MNSHLEKNMSHHSQDQLQDEPKTTLVSKNITVLGRRTSVRLEPEMWVAIRDIAVREQCSIHEICSLVSIRKNVKTSLTAAIRVFIMLYFKAAATEEGHHRAGHGDFHSMRQRARVPEQVLMRPKKRQYPPQHNDYSDVAAVS